MLRGSHFLQLEHPECVHEELLALVARAHPDGAPVSEREPG
ncbi:hypothetical protein [Nocardioides mesophilus]|nr:hypothetical protein [Nocardioides mesophilus]